MHYSILSSINATILLVGCLEAKKNRRGNRGSACSIINSILIKGGLSFPELFIKAADRFIQKPLFINIAGIFYPTGEPILGIYFVTAGFVVKDPRPGLTHFTRCALYLLQPRLVNNSGFPELFIKIAD